MTVKLNKKGNTKVYKQDSDDVERPEYTVVKLYNTDVVKFNDFEILLDTGGWETVTTKQRMNQASKEYDLGYHVFQEKNKWYVHYVVTTYPFTGSIMRLIRHKGIESEA